MFSSGTVEGTVGIEPFSSRSDSISEEIETILAFIVAMTPAVATFSDEDHSLLEENEWLPKKPNTFSMASTKFPLEPRWPTGFETTRSERRQQRPRRS
jgi:hypothetical protein